MFIVALAISSKSVAREILGFLVEKVLLHPEAVPDVQPTVSVRWVGDGKCLSVCRFQ